MRGVVARSDRATAPAAKIALGGNIKLLLAGLEAGPSSKIDGVQTTTLQTGSHRAAPLTGRASGDAEAARSLRRAGAVVPRGRHPKAGAA
jgi:hypothetical protein